MLSSLARKSFVRASFRGISRQTIHRRHQSPLNRSSSLFSHFSTMSQRGTDYLVWVDLEMTGLNINKDRIIEMAVIVTDKDLNIVAEVRWPHKNVL